MFELRNEFYICLIVGTKIFSELNNYQIWVFYPRKYTHVDCALDVFNYLNIENSITNTFAQNRYLLNFYNANNSFDIYICTSYNNKLK